MPPTKRASGSVTGSTNLTTNKSAGDKQRVIRDFYWNVASLNSYLEDINQIWAGRLGISESQWLILLAIEELDDGKGVPGTSICAKIHIHSAFVTAQTKSLEKAGFLTRVASSTDARFVLMSLTAKAREEITKLSDHRLELNDAIFTGLNDQSLREIADQLAVIKNNADKAARRLAVDN